MNYLPLIWAKSSEVTLKQQDGSWLQTGLSSPEWRWWCRNISWYLSLVYRLVYFPVALNTSDARGRGQCDTLQSKGRGGQHPEKFLIHSLEELMLFSLDLVFSLFIQSTKQHYEMVVLGLYPFYRWCHRGGVESHNVLKVIWWLIFGAKIQSQVAWL